MGSQEAGKQPPDATMRGGEGGASAREGMELGATAMVAAWGARARTSRRRTLQGNDIHPQIVAAACAPAAARSAAQLEVLSSLLPQHLSPSTACSLLTPLN